ncbi:MAG: single-stranded DNA-binding protein [Oscillospiraceae bacterium]|nr:single-stranded DNA-binding protein [Oscillospiraceae bacterium]
MDLCLPDNEVILCGTCLEEPVYSHAARSQSFYTLPLLVRRLSGAADTVNVTIRETMLGTAEQGGRLCVTGEVRTFNNRSGEWPRLVISVFARTLAPTEEADENRVRLRGALCKSPNLRTTPMGREICDLILAVNRRYGRSDYLPCICWGSKAREAALWEVGTRLLLEGRIQSRRYSKLTENGSEERTAYEISAAQIDPICMP